MALLTIAIVYYKKVPQNNFLFYGSLLISGVGESILLYGMEQNYLVINSCFIIYCWLLILLIRGSAKNVEYQFKKEYILPTIVSTGLILFLLYYVLILVLPKLIDIVVYTYFFLFSLIVLLSYLAIIFVSKHNRRYIWLLFLLMAFVLSTILDSLESLYFNSEIVAQFVYIIQFASHFFLLKFLITEDEEIMYL